MGETGIVTADGANQFFDASGRMKSLADVSGVLRTALEGQTEQQKLATLNTLLAATRSGPPRCSTTRAPKGSGA